MLLVIAIIKLDIHVSGRDAQSCTAQEEQMDAAPQLTPEHLVIIVVNIANNARPLKLITQANDSAMTHCGRLSLAS